MNCRRRNMYLSTPKLVAASNLSRLVSLHEASRSLFSRMEKFLFSKGLDVMSPLERFEKRIRDAVAQDPGILASPSLTRPSSFLSTLGYFASP